MTMITYHQDSGPVSRPYALVGPALQLFTKLRDRWHRRQTERMLEGLDPAIRKDIGWPTTDTVKIGK